MSWQTAGGTLPSNRSLRNMRHLRLAALLCVALTVPGQAQNPSARSELESTLTFETTHTGALPSGWAGGPPGTVVIDGDVVHGGRWAVRLERTATSPQNFSTLTRSIPIDFSGTTIEWRGFLRSENVSEYMALWMRQDRDGSVVQFATMQPRQIKGTNDWTEYSITFPLHGEANQLYFGVLLGGTGKVWVDDLRLLVDGRPVSEAPKAERPKTPLELDHQFDSGSGITISALSNTQIDNLTALGKIWGFLKYHHPAVTSGTRHWDYDLFRVMPGVLSAPTRETAEAVLRDWVRQLGAPPICERCTTPNGDDVHLRPNLGWIDSGVGAELAGLLRAVHRGRSQGRQFYVTSAPNVGNPLFERDLPYASQTFPDAGYQLLGLYRLWNIIEYWFPYRDLLDENWDEILAQFIPRIALAKSKDAYQLEMLAFIAKISDTHANLNVPATVRPPAGACQLPVVTRFIEGEAVVVGYSDAAAGPATGLQIGDVIEALDGSRVQELVKRWEPHYPASNQPTRLRDIARALTRGACAGARVTVRRASGVIETTAQRQPSSSLNVQAGITHDLPGATFRLLSDQVAYLKLSSVQAAQAAGYVERAKGTSGLVIDIRNYPAEFVVFALGSLLVERPTPFARFTTGDAGNPGAFKWSAPTSLTPQQPHYPGKIVVLVDEVSMSQAEYTAMALRAAPRTTVVGSTTAGADGNVSPISLPGGLRTMISGIGVFYPDKRPTQRVGIVPDVEVRPTIAGIRAGRDEVLEEAVRQILGPDVPADQIRKMTAPVR